MDPIEVYAYVAKAQENEALVEDKRKQEEEAMETSQRNTRTNMRNDEGHVQKSTLSLEVQMENAQKDKKQGRPCTS